MTTPTAARSARLLAFSWASSWAGVPITGAFASVIVLKLTNDLALTGIPFFVFYLGSLLGSYPSGHLMDRYGRKPVLIGGHLLTGTGHAVGALAILAGNVWVFVGSLLVAALGNSATYLTRLAAADLYPAAERARGLGRLVFFLVFGALLGTPIIWASQRIGPAIGQPVLAVAWTSLPILSLAAAFFVSRIQPDPKETARLIHAEDPASSVAAADAAGRLPVRTIVAAALCILFAQGTMAGVMSVSGASLAHAGHTDGFVSSALTLHILAMFGLSPLIGVIGDRWGRPNLLMLSGLYLVGATLLVSQSPTGEILVAGLFAVGVGWSFAFLGATAIVADATPIHLRGRVLGAIDVATAVTGGLASLAAGWRLDVGGIRAVGFLGFLLSLGVVAGAILARGVSARAKRPALGSPNDLGQ